MGAITGLLDRLILDRLNEQISRRARVRASLIRGVDLHTRQVVVATTLCFTVEASELGEVEFLALEAQHPREYLRKAKDVYLLVPPRLEGPSLPFRMEGHCTTWLLPVEDLEAYVKVAGMPETFRLTPVARVRHGMQVRWVRGRDVRSDLARMHSRHRAEPVGSLLTW